MSSSGSRRHRRSLPGTPHQLHVTERDKYGRLLVHVMVNGEDVACVLIREGYARPWRGRRGNWCVKVDPADSAASKLDCTIISSIETC